MSGSGQCLGCRAISTSGVTCHVQYDTWRYSRQLPQPIKPTTIKSKERDLPIRPRNNRPWRIEKKPAGGKSGRQQQTQEPPHSRNHRPPSVVLFAQCLPATTRVLLLLRARKPWNKKVTSSIMFGLRLPPLFLQQQGDHTADGSGEPQKPEPPPHSRPPEFGLSTEEAEKNPLSVVQEGSESAAITTATITKARLETTTPVATAGGGDAGPTDAAATVVPQQPPTVQDTERAGTPDNNNNDDDSPPILLYKSPRLKGYITIVLAAGIHFNAVQRSAVSNQPKVVPSTSGQRQYGLAVCTVDMVLATVAVLCHLDRVTPLEKVWISTFRPKSRIELLLTLFLAAWNVIATGVETSVGGIAGDGKGQYNIYFSVWILCLTSFWILERWWVGTCVACGGTVVWCFFLPVYGGGNCLTPLAAPIDIHTFPSPTDPSIQTLAGPASDHSSPAGHTGPRPGFASCS